MFLKAGFSVAELMSIGLSGECYSKLPRNTFLGLEGRWHELTHWSIMDLVAASANIEEIKSLGANIDTLRSRPMFTHGIPRLCNVTMENWRDFGMTKQIMIHHRFDNAFYNKCGWTYGSIAACWGFTPTDMAHVGYRINVIG